MKSESVSFLINGTVHTVNASDGKVGPESRLVDFIRNEAKLKGTKWMCREGGCGACVVTVRTKDPANGSQVIRAVNSCLAPVWSCDGWDISTVEDLGNGKKGYHSIQKRLAAFGGTQCGYCSAGMVMNMHALSNSKKNGLTSQDVEDNFDGNICRCTGYRPILDAMKSFTVDAAPELIQRCLDIEDICGDCPAKNGTTNGTTNGKCPDAGASCGGGCCSRPANFSQLTNLNLHLTTGETWVKALDLQTVFDTVRNFTKNNYKYRIVAGNTGSGVFKFDGPYDAFLEINSVPELVTHSLNKTDATLGGATSLTRAIQILHDLSTNEGFEYTREMSRHIKRVANTPVRNFGTIAGNLMMKHAHNDFPSDIFLLLETAGAKLYIASSASEIEGYSPIDFLNVDMNGKVIVYLTLPKREPGHFFRSFKITKRHQNAHAYVNAGFLFQVDPAQNFKVLKPPTITFGGISDTFLRAVKTENFLNGAELGDVRVMREALQSLEREIEPDYILPDATPQYRKSLTLNLLYKAILGILASQKGKLANHLESGGLDLPRKIQTGQQNYDKDEDKESPLYKPVTKIEGTKQTSGEAEYVNDIPKQDGEVYGTFVRTTVANAKLKNVDTSEALKVPGVLRYFDYKDIPGKNSFYDGFFIPVQEMLFVENEILASGQAVGLIVAETQEAANLGAKKVIVEYTDQKKPILTIKQAIEKAKEDKTYDKIMSPMILKTAEEPSKEAKHVIKGEFQIGGQAHFSMETYVTLCIPKDGDILSVFTGTQFKDLAQTQISRALNLPANLIEIQVRRLGGGYGGKIIRQNQVAVAACLVAHLMGRPCRIVLDLEANMEMAGKRLPYYAEYEAGFNDDGKIEALDCTIICDTGMLPSDPTSVMAAMFMQSCYAAQGWIIKPGATCTMTHTNTYCRAPGTTQGIAIIENIMEHVAHTLNKDGVDVRAANYLKTGDTLIMSLEHAPLVKFEGVNLVPSIVEEMKKIADYDNRKKEIEEFNRANRWQKKGLAMVPMRYLQPFHGMSLPCFVAIHHQDGTVSVSHGGVEMGQGINTKVAQVVAHTLKIPMSKISIKSANNLVSANTSGTGGAIGSELVCYATLRACEMLVERMEPIKKGLEGEFSWEELVAKTYGAGIDLRATYLQSKNDPIKPYEIYGCNLTEVQVDILTGEYKISRLDLIEDAGKSMSPEVDLGQIEGALVMGLGLWTEEKLVFEPNTGRLLTRNTWEYKVPLPKSTPEDFRVTMMRNAPNPHGVLQSKATGEPPVCLAVAVFFAIKNAIKSARKDAGNDEWFELDGPVTPEDIVRLSLTSPHKEFIY